jgi:hypothetical protein
VALSGCRIQQSSFDSNLEIKTGKNTTLEQSHKLFKLEVSDIALSAPNITIDELSTLSVNQLVTVKGKIVKVYASADVKSKNGKTLTKQDCMLRDTSDTCRIVMWQQDVGKLITGNVTS